MPISAHFHVIHIASALTSSSVTSGWYRMPPFDGPPGSVRILAIR
jgi:hypothetical protein